MSLWTPIARAALKRINEERITSIDDTTLLAQDVRDQKDDVAKEVLEAHDWNSATKREGLTKSNDPIVGMYHSHYGLPSDFVRAINVFPKGTTEDGTVVWGAVPFIDWRAESDKLLLGNRSPASAGVGLTYVAYDETMMGRWSPTLKAAIAALLASRLAVGTVGSTKLQDRAEAEYERLLRRAQRFDTYREGDLQQTYDNDDVGETSPTYSQLTAGGGVASDEVDFSGTW